MGEDDYDSSEVSALDRAEASFPAPEELHDSRTSRSNIWNGVSSSQRNDGITSSTASTERNNNKKACRLYTLLAAVMVLVFLVITPAVVVSKNKNKESSVQESDTNDTPSTTGTGTTTGTGSSAPAQDRSRPTFDEISKYIVDQGISTASDLNGPETPQYQAAMWLTQNDTANITVPTSDISMFDGYRYMTRYVMAVNYFAFNGSNWDDDLNWMTGLDVCKWSKYTPEYNSLGLFCFSMDGQAEDGTVTIADTPSVLKLGTCATLHVY